MFYHKVANSVQFTYVLFDRLSLAKLGWLCDHRGKRAHQYSALSTSQAGLHTGSFSSYMWYRYHRKYV